MDVVAAAQAGIKNTVAVSGTALTPDQINIVKRYTNNLKMFFDMDKAGEEATKKSLKLCFERDMNVKVVELPEGKDAADLAKSNPELLKEAVIKSSDAMEYFFRKVFSKENKEDVEGKKKIANEILDMIAHVFSEIGKNHWIKKLGEEMDIKESVLTDMLKKVTLRSVNVKDTGEEREKEKTAEKSKLEILIEDLIGLMLVHENIWRKVVMEESGNQHLLKDDILSTMLLSGEYLKFNFDNLIKNLKQSESISRAERIYFEKKYRPDLNNNIEEIVYDNPLEDCSRCLKEIRRELKRNEMERIEKDLKMAEKNKDQEAIQFLREEVKRMSNELKS